MNADKTHNTHRILSLFLTVLLLFPLSANIVHLIDHDPHYSCQDSTTHFHESEFACELCDLQIVNVIEFVPYTFSTVTTAITEKHFFSVNSINYSVPSFHFSLRGPPQTV